LIVLHAAITIYSDDDDRLYAARSVNISVDKTANDNDKSVRSLVGQHAARLHTSECDGL